MRNGWINENFRLNVAQVLILFILTVIVGVAQDVLFDVFILAGMVFVLEPHGDGKVLRQVVRHDFRWNSHACWSIKHEDLDDAMMS